MPLLKTIEGRLRGKIEDIKIQREIKKHQKEKEKLAFRESFLKGRIEGARKAGYARGKESAKGMGKSRLETAAGILGVVGKDLMGDLMPEERKSPKKKRKSTKKRKKPKRKARSKESDFFPSWI